jgi:hypothetical protein
VSEIEVSGPPARPGSVYGSLLRPRPPAATYGLVRHLRDQAAPTPPQAGRVALRDGAAAFRLLLDAAAGYPGVPEDLGAMLGSWVARCSPEELDRVRRAADQLSALCRQQKG